VKVAATAAALLAGATIATAVPTGAYGSQPDSRQAAAKLRKLKHEIARLKAQEASELKHKQHVQSELADLEKHIGSLSRELGKLSHREKALGHRRDKLARKTAQSRKAADQARDELATALRSAFVLGREPRLKLLLEGDQPATAARLLAYYGYYSRARSQQLKTLTATLARYHKLQSDLADTSRELKHTEKARRDSLADLKQTRKHRQAVVAKLAHDIADKKARAKALSRSARRLEHVIHSVTSDLSDVPSKMLDDVNFGKLRGRLPWPVSGHMADRFGSARAGGELKWEAVRIAAPAGTRVHAIAYGRIAYAGWLPYYGLVLMIDHGDGYLTVYGHNEALYKQVGDWVKSGDVIATVGTSGGQDKPVLYFQIRHGQHPLNPARWCAHGKP